MASTYSQSLRIQLIGTGDQSGVWGTTTNNNLGTIIEQAITGYASISVAGLTTYTLTAFNGISDQARNAVLEFTGALSANCTIITPAVPKNYFIKNSTTGGFSIIISTGTGSTVTIPSGQVFNVYSDGTNYYLSTNYNSTSVAITGGTINGTTIGATTPSTGAFTTLSTSGALTYGGVTLSNSVTGTGSMVLSSAPILTTPLLSAETYSTNSSVSAAGTTQGTGTALVSDYNIITTVAASAGVVLPTATIGRRIIVVNRGVNTLSVYPASGASIDALSSNTAISIPVAGWMEFNASTTTQWYSTFNVTNATSFSAGTTGLTPSTATTGTITLGGTLNVANGGTGVTTSTGSGSNVLSTSPTLTTPILGTPQSGTLTSCTGLPISTGVSGLGSGVATFLGTPSSSNLAAAVTDETGSGALVFSTSPSITNASLTTPALSGETFSTAATVTAGTNAQGQGAITSDNNVITTTATNPSGVTLPTATTGRRIVIVNKGTNSVNVYPATGGTIDSLTINTSIALPVGGVMIFNASSTTQWYSSFNLYTSATVAAGVTSFSGGSTGLTPSSATSGAITLSGTLVAGNGGTGQSSYTTGDILFASSSSALSKLSASSTAGQPIISNGSGVAPSYGTLPVLGGGTGVTTSTGTGSTVLSASPTLTGTPIAPTAVAGTNTTQISTTAFVTTAIQTLYPIGSIYSSTVATNPNTLFGFGTWVAFGAGRVLIGQSGVAPYVAGSTGGSADAVVVSHTHTATVTDSGHSHSLTNYGSAQAGDDNGGAPVMAATGFSTGRNPNPTNSATTGITVANSTTGSSATNANLQPYVVVYMWNRTA
jgi:hypothetical protein